MAISEHQVNNVLRVYGDQLLQIIKNSDTKASDKISIYTKARRKTIINDIISHIIERITKSVPHDNVENEVFKTFESDYREPFAINKGRHNELIFKEIDGNDETINSVSIEDSEFLTNKLIVITKKTLEKNMK
jgi:hypothetical protein